jgi:hypothetical protein
MTSPAVARWLGPAARMDAVCRICNDKAAEWEALQGAPAPAVWLSEGAHGHLHGSLLSSVTLRVNENGGEA